MASTLGKIITVFRFNSLLSTPSSRKLLSRVRMPLATKVDDMRQPSLPDPSLFAPGTPRDTPGISRVNWTKSRPFKGSSLTCVSFTVAPSSELSACTNETAAFTCTDSVTSPISSFRSTRAF